MNVNSVAGVLVAWYNCRLSNDPGKVESNFFYYAAMCFPHIGMFSFLHRVCTNLLKGRLHDKMYLNSILKGCFFMLKDFDQSSSRIHTSKFSVPTFICPCT